MTQIPDLIVSAVSIGLGLGTIYVTWLNPSSRFAPLLSARWRIFGAIASKSGASAQVALLFSVGLLCLLSGLGNSLVWVALFPFVASLFACVIARFSDWGQDEA
jgi:hypothetical protein